MLVVGRRAWRAELLISYCGAARRVLFPGDGGHRAAEEPVSRFGRRVPEPRLGTWSGPRACVQPVSVGRMARGHGRPRCPAEAPGSGDRPPHLPTTQLRLGRLVLSAHSTPAGISGWGSHPQVLHLVGEALWVPLPVLATAGPATVIAGLVLPPALLSGSDPRNPPRQVCRCTSHAGEPRAHPHSTGPLLCTSGPRTARPELLTGRRSPKAKAGTEWTAGTRQSPRHRPLPAVMEVTRATATQLPQPSLQALLRPGACTPAPDLLMGARLQPRQTACCTQKRRSPVVLGAFVERERHRRARVHRSCCP